MHTPSDPSAASWSASPNAEPAENEELVSVLRYRWTAMDSDQLFLQTLDELKVRLAQTPDEYSVIRIAAILRQLLLDEQPLVEQVNRGRQTKLRFRFYEAALPAMPGATLVAATISIQPGPNPPTGGRVVEGTLKQLLAAPAAYFKGRLASVRDVIRYGANVAGGVHHSSAKTDQDQALLGFGRLMDAFGLPADVRSLVGIGYVVADGLEPLRDAVMRGAAGKSPTFVKRSRPGQFGGRVLRGVTAAGQEAEACPVQEAGDLAGYDAFAIGSAAYSMHWMKEAVEFVRYNRALLADRVCPWISRAA